MSSLNQTERKSCEYPVTEAIFGGVIAMIVVGFTIQRITFDTILTYLREVDKIMTPESVLQCNNISNYINDIYTNKQPNEKKKACVKFIENLKKEITNTSSPLYYYIDNNMIDKIYVTGKNHKVEEILNLNKDLDKKSSKPDVYIKLKGMDKWTGWSIKQSKDDTKTNYSINNLLSHEEDKERLKKNKKKFLSTHNIPRLTGKTKEEKKNIRKKVNKLLHDPENELWESYRPIIEKIENNNTIKYKLVMYLYCLLVEYPIYEYDGEKVIDYSNIKNTLDLDSIIFSEHKPFYLKKDGEPRQAAKMFYKLSFNNESYKVELRFKGSYSANPQLLCYKIYEEEEDEDDNENKQQENVINNNNNNNNETELPLDLTEPRLVDGESTEDNINAVKNAQQQHNNNSINEDDEEKK